MKKNLHEIVINALEDVKAQDIVSINVMELTGVMDSDGPSEVEQHIAAPVAYMRGAHALGPVLYAHAFDMRAAHSSAR